MRTNNPSPSSLNLAYVEALYADFVRDPDSVASEWREYFSKTFNGAGTQFRPGPSFRPASLFHPPRETSAVHPPAGSPDRVASLQDKVNQLIRNYRVRGHMSARIDPLDFPRPSPPELQPDFLGLTRDDLKMPVTTETLQCDGCRTVGDILEVLRDTYCRSIGAQFMHIDDLAVRRWLQRRMEGTRNRIQLTREEQLRILSRLTDAVVFEEFIRKKYIGAKSFSLEGCESLIPLLDLAIENAGEQGVQEIVLGMAHRGRLNVLANIMGKNPSHIFREFEDTDHDQQIGRGDVKYHLGYSNDWVTAGGRSVHLSLCFNPSHLGFVGPVALGRVRAKQDRVGDRDRTRCMPLLIHGDAAFAGEGVTQETLQLSQLPAYTVGGTLHVIVNNQIGFTTSPADARSSTYATDVAKLLQAPIFHVNGEDPEAVAQVVRLAMDFRKEFRQDVFIDMYGYRRLGHNESDEPSFTQPLLYRAIEQRKPVREGYLDHLLSLGGITRSEADDIATRRREHLESELSHARTEAYRRPQEKLRGVWSRSTYTGGPDSKVKDARTAVGEKRLARLLDGLTRLPAGFHPHPKIAKFLEHRKKMASGRQSLDWSAAEALALATLAAEGVRIRLTGQDAERGTFSHRHAVLHDHENNHLHVPLQNVSKDQAPVEIHNSPLSEIAVLGFDYGFSLDYPDGLALWEAQFGDFVNVAQMIIDQFLASAEDKWRRLSGLVMLLPHGFEGQGPEHSSARLERFLTLAAADNIQVVYPTTPAQYFHCLRRQVLRPWRKPLVVMTPKSLLRHPSVVSSFKEFSRGTFQRILQDTRNKTAKKTSRILLCSGKVYYELEARRTELGRQDVAILRLEQLYPLRHEELKSALAPYPDATPVFWVQEEPENMGAWRFLRTQFGERLFGRMEFAGISRPASASPATGSVSAHKKEQQKLLDEAFGGG